ncbi:MAG: magnesium transporter CorA family protein, partial [Chitinophagales bacterium]
MDLQSLADQLDIPIDFFIDSLDIDERSRYEQDEGVQLIVVNIPIKNPKEDKYTPPYITIPIGMIEVDDYIITLSAYENPVINHLLSRLPKSFSTTDHSQLVLIVFEKTVDYFIHYLRMINNQRGEYEKELYNSTRNQELSSMMNLQKSLVYFLTNLRDNSMMMFKIQRTDFLRIQNNEEQQDLFEDILIDMEQAQDMAATYSDILRNTMEALSSMISNNLNTIMKRLTSITIVLMVPTLVASFYG